MNFKGDIDKKYLATVQKSNKPKRANIAAVWPKDEEENSKRLEDAGTICSRGIPVCSRCGGK